MAIPRDKSRIILTLKDFTKSCIEYLSENDKRTPSKEIEYIIEEYIQQLERANENISDELNMYYHDIYKPKEICNTILSYWRQATRPMFRNKTGLDIPFAEVCDTFEVLLYKDPYLQKDFITFNGDENNVLNYLDKMMFEMNIDLESSKYIQGTIVKLFLGF